MADRYTYLPLIGVALALAFWVQGLLRARRLPRGLPIAAVAVLAGCLVLTRVQTGYWRTTEGLFRHTLAVTKRNWVALSTIGIELAGDRRYEEAMTYLRQALALRPDYAFTHYAIGNAWREQGRLQEAIASYRTALGLAPGAPEVYNNLGAALAQSGAPRQGAQYIRTALRLKPDYPEAESNLRAVLAMLAPPP